MGFIKVYIKMTRVRFFLSLTRCECTCPIFHRFFHMSLVWLY